MDRRCVTSKLESLQGKNSTVRAKQITEKRVIKSMTIKLVTLNKSRSVSSSISTRKANRPVITSVRLLRHHRVFISRVKPPIVRSDDQADCRVQPVNERIEEDGNISDASTVLNEDTQTPPSSPELILGA